MKRLYNTADAILMRTCCVATLAVSGVAFCRGRDLDPPAELSLSTASCSAFRTLVARDCILQAPLLSS